MFRNSIFYLFSKGGLGMCMQSHMCVCMSNEFLNMCATCVCAGIFGLITHHTCATAHFAHFDRKTKTKKLYFRKCCFLHFFLYKVVFEINFVQKSAGASGKCNYQKMKVRTRVHGHSYVDLRGACDAKKGETIPLLILLMKTWKKMLKGRIL